MGVLKNLFDRENPFLIQYSLLTLIGFWRVDTPKKWARDLYAVYRFFAVSSVTGLLLTEIIDMIMISQDSSKMAERIFAASVTCIVTTRTHSMLRRIDRYEDLQERLVQFREMRSKNPEDVRVINEASELISRVARVFLGSALIGAIFWSLHPILYEDRKLPFPIRVPVDVEKSPYYEILYIYVTVVLITFAMSSGAVVLGYSSYLTIIQAQFQVVKRNIESISEERDEVARRELFLSEFNAGRPSRAKSEREREAEEKEKKDARTMAILKDAIQTQLFIYEEVDSFKELQSEHLLVHVLGIVLGLGVIEITGATEDYTVHRVKKLLILGLGILDVFSICLFGELLQQKSCETAEALYMVPWHEMGIKVQKVLLMMSVRSQRPCIIKAGGTIRMNLATYLNLMKISYNFMLLLRHNSSLNRSS